MRSRRALPFLCAVLLSVLALGAAAPEAAPENEEPTPAQRIDRELNDVMWMVKNAQAKLRKGVMSPNESKGSGSATTPALRCCSNNLDSVRDHLSNVFDATTELRAEINASGTPNTVALERLSDIEMYAEMLLRSMRSFETAPTKEEAEAGLRAMTQAFLRTRGSADEAFKRLGFEPPLEERLSPRKH
jgi:hypothetical protein